MLRAAGDPTRLRLLLLLREAELTVSELVEIVGQSQPRVSRHLKLLGEAGQQSGSATAFLAEQVLGLGARTGLAIAIARKVRMLFWGIAGGLVLVREGLSPGTLPASSDRGESSSGPHDRHSG